VAGGWLSEAGDVSGVVAIAEWADLVSDEHYSVDGSQLFTQPQDTHL